MPLLEALPAEVLRVIVVESGLNARDWLALAGTCRSWRNQTLDILSRFVIVLDLSLGVHTDDVTRVRGDNGRLLRQAIKEHHPSSRPHVLGWRVRSLTALLRLLPRLQVLVLDHCAQLTSEAIVDGIAAHKEAQSALKGRSSDAANEGLGEELGLSVLSLRDLEVLSGTTANSYDTVSRLLAFCGTTLRVLDTRTTIWGGAPDIAEWLIRATRLEELMVWGAARPEQRHLCMSFSAAATSGHLQKLRVLDLWNCVLPDFSELIGRADVATVLPALEVLQLDSAKDLCADALASFARCGPSRLSRLGMGYGKAVDWQPAMHGLSEHAQFQLSGLSLRGLRWLSVTELIALVRRFARTLTDIDVGLLQAVTSDVLCEIVRICGKHLRSLFLFNTPAICDRGMEHIAQHCKVLRSLELWTHGPGITDVGLGLLSTPSESSTLGFNVASFLQELNLRGNTRITTSGVEGICDAATDLHVLDLHGCTNLSGPARFTNLSHLREFGLGICEDLETSKIFCELASASHLQLLNVVGVVRLSDTDLHLLSEFDTLRNVMLRECTSVSSSGLEAFLKRGGRGRQNLVALSLSELSCVNDNICRVIAEFCPNLMELSLCSDFLSVAGLRQIVLAGSIVDLTVVSSAESISWPQIAALEQEHVLKWGWDLDISFESRMHQTAESDDSNGDMSDEAP